MRRKTLGTINASIAAISYGTNPLFALPLYAAGLRVESVLFYRYLTAAFIYFFVLKFFKKISLKLNRGEFFALILLGLIFSLASFTLFNSFRYIDSGLACTILFIYPIITAVIMSVFFKEKLTKRILLSIFLTTVGIIFLYNGNSAQTLNIKGVAFVLVSAVFYALYMVGIKQLKPLKHLKNDALNFYVMVFCFLFFAFNLKLGIELQPIKTPFLLLCASLLAIFPTIFSLETTTNAIKLIGATKTAIIGALEPLTAIFFGVLLFGEHLSLKIIFGVVLILVGVSFVILQRKSKSA